MAERVGGLLSRNSTPDRGPPLILPDDSVISYSGGPEYEITTKGGSSSVIVGARLATVSASVQFLLEHGAVTSPTTAIVSLRTSSAESGTTHPL